MSNYVVSNKLNLRNNDYVAGVGLTQEFLSQLGCKAFTAFDSKHSRINEKGYRPVEKADESAFDKVICQYDQKLFQGNRVLDHIYRMTENNGYALLLDIPEDLELLLRDIMTRNQSVSDCWFFESEEKGKYDVYFKVRKDAF